MKCERNENIQEHTQRQLQNKGRFKYISKLWKIITQKQTDFINFDNGNKTINSNNFAIYPIGEMNTFTIDTAVLKKYVGITQ